MTPVDQELDRDVEIRVGDVTLEGMFDVPAGARGIVVFVHGSGSSRLSPRNQAVATALRDRGLGTLLFDLLSADEETADRETGRLRFDLGLLARRLEAATDWLRARPEAKGLPVAYFGSSTGGGAALLAASRRPDRVACVVSRGGRPDLVAGADLGRVRAPTLLLVGGDDGPVIAMNEAALRELRCTKELSIVGGASHLFEEPGALEEVARRAGDWFLAHLAARRNP